MLPRAALVVAAGVAVAVPVAIAAGGPPQGSPATCRQQSSAGFQPSPDNLTVGPLTLVSAQRATTPETVARFGGNKFPALVRVGHRVVVEVVSAQRGRVSLYYGDHHTGVIRRVAAGDPVVDFRACPAGRGGGSRYGARAVTFWSGFVLTSAPRCVRLRVWVDGEATPRHARIPLGRPCG